MSLDSNYTQDTKIRLSTSFVHWGLSKSKKIVKLFLNFFSSALRCDYVFSLLVPSVCVCTCVGLCVGMVGVAYTDENARNIWKRQTSFNAFNFDKFVFVVFYFVFFNLSWQVSAVFSLSSFVTAGFFVHSTVELYSSAVVLCETV